MTTIFYNEAEKIMKSSKETKVTTNESLLTNEKWKKLLDSNDSRLIWKSIGWNGDIVTESEKKPSDSEFKKHFEELLNPQNVNTEIGSACSNINIPILDDEIDPNEVQDALRSSNSNKAFIGIDPGFLKILPMNWILLITVIFNRIFVGTYPQAWCFSKFIVLFKKGCRYMCGNYRGITITDTLAKLYDKVIYNRLKLWISIDKCQAGSLEGRGCTEQILALRLLIDYAKSENKKLYLLHRL